MSVRLFFHGGLDYENARHLQNRLHAYGFHTWSEHWDSDPMKLVRVEWQVERAILQSDVVLICVSGRKPSFHWTDDDNIARVLTIAESRPSHVKVIIVVRLSDTALPTQLRPESHPSQRLRWRYVDIFGALGLPDLLEILAATGIPQGPVNYEYLQQFDEYLRQFDHTNLLDSAGLPLARSPLIVSVKEVNASLLQQLQAHPTSWYQLSPARFEEIVAELLIQQGYAITRTPLSRDGGFDMYAAKKDNLGEFLYLVECKRYTPPNRVGVEVVRALKGVLDDQRATAAAIVTTSYFTKGARELQERNEYSLKLHDYSTLQAWLRMRSKDTA